ncbi:hypothetical protein JRI60_09020 [Archangium violaceum]|uniref:hypothetical protein n=1 Tax=Archangium violaceum TaxID=83451 RepID=UPI00194E1F00|nr:hypothetical protein [Archangium violaceum]QRN99139.1 hypothetical protein JRI60_09020 [Archangium violaceum]
MKATKKKGRRLGPFQLGRQCKHAAAELGPIHEARNVHTGAPALVMTPGPRWKPRRNWQVRVFFQVTPPFIAVQVEQAPVSGKLAELARLFTLPLAGLDAVGNDPRMRAHLTRQPLGRFMRRPPLKVLAAAGFTVLALGTGLWLGLSGNPKGLEGEERAAHGVASEAVSPADAPKLTDTASPSSGPIAYPLPQKPFRNQAAAPCQPKRDEVEINGGCWVELARRPPCIEDQAEYQGKCYLPVSKDRGRPPQSVHP